MGKIRTNERCLCRAVQDPARAAVVSPGRQPLQPAAGRAGGAHADEETHPGYQRAPGAGGLPGYESARYFEALADRRRLRANVCVCLLQKCCSRWPSARRRPTPTVSDGPATSTPKVPPTPTSSSRPEEGEMLRCIAFEKTPPVYILVSLKRCPTI